MIVAEADSEIPDLSPPKNRQEAFEQARNMIAFWNRRIVEASFSQKWGSSGHSNELPSLSEMRKELAKWENKLSDLQNPGGWNIGSFAFRDY